MVMFKNEVVKQSLDGQRSDFDITTKAMNDIEREFEGARTEEVDEEEHHTIGNELHNNQA